MLLEQFRAFERDTIIANGAKLGVTKFEAQSCLAAMADYLGPPNLAILTL